jgi:hypothetical protein
MKDLPEPEYNEHDCITAQELREAGVPVPDNIPDCGWIPREAWKWRVEDIVEISEGRGRATIVVKFTEPFRWAEVELPGKALQKSLESLGQGLEHCYGAHCGGVEDYDRCLCLCKECTKAREADQ